MKVPSGFLEICWNLKQFEIYVEVYNRVEAIGSERRYLATKA